MTTTGYPKAGPSKATHRGYEFVYLGRHFEVIDSGPVPSSVWAVEVGTQEAFAFRLNRGTIMEDLGRPVLGFGGFCRNTSGTYGRLTYDYGDPVNYVPWKLCTERDFRK